MVTPFSISSSSPFLSPTKSLRSSSSLMVTKAPPLHFLHCKRLLSVSVTSSLQKSDSDSPPLSPKVETFWQWLRDEGVVSAKAPARPAVVPEGLGLVAQRDLSRSEVVLEVPKRFWINPDAVAASEITVCSELKPRVSVALFLIREKLKNDSPLRYYLDILPEYTHSTIYCAGQNRSWLNFKATANCLPSFSVRKSIMGILLSRVSTFQNGSASHRYDIVGTQLLSTTLNVKEYARNEFKKWKKKLYLLTSSFFLLR